MEAIPGTSQRSRMAVCPKRYTATARVKQGKSSLYTTESLCVRIVLKIVPHECLDLFPVRPPGGLRYCRPGESVALPYQWIANVRA